MLKTSARLLRLLSVLQSRRHWSGSELSERVGVDARTIRRDIDRLRELGYAVEASPGLGGGYQLKPGSALPPVLLEHVPRQTVCARGLGRVGRAPNSALPTRIRVAPSSIATS